MLFHVGPHRETSEDTHSAPQFYVPWILKHGIRVASLPPVITVILKNAVVFWCLADHSAFNLLTFGSY